MFVRQSTYDREVQERKVAEHALSDMIDMYNDLVRRINRHGGEELFRKTEPKYSTPLSKDDINRLLMLCHPDKHGGKKVAEDMTRKLLELRG